MTENEFHAVKFKLQTSLETFIDACADMDYDLDEEVADILSNYDIEL